MDSLLIANRGEVAVRIIRTCRKLGIRTVAVYSDPDVDAPHVVLADSALRIGPAEVAESYLSIDAVVRAAIAGDVEGVHPGYGFLSENADFANALLSAGLTFIGPPPAALASLGDKRVARGIALQAGLEVLPSADVSDGGIAAEAVADLGLPLLVKAAFGGGGRGQRVVTEAEHLPNAILAAQRESVKAFGRAEVYVERFLPRARHIEVQILADRHGNVVHLDTRDCTVQRRHQKLVEEAPATFPSQLKAQALDGACQIAKLVEYQGAATVEFLVDIATGDLYFLEVNARLQVEHTVTELITGIDLVEAQILIASGEPLPWRQGDISTNGHAIEARLNAEDAAAGFLPQTGTVHHLFLPGGPWIRTDCGVSAGSEISPYYDSLIAKISAWGPTRDDARRRLRSALDEVEIAGVATTTDYVSQVLAHPTFCLDEHWTGFVDSVPIPVAELQAVPRAPGAAVFGPRIRKLRVSTSSGVLSLDVPIHGVVHREQLSRHVGEAEEPPHVAVPLPGDRQGAVARMDAVLIRHAVTAGDVVEATTVVAVLESMKMEMHVLSGSAGVVVALHGAAGEAVRSGTVLVEVEPVSA